MANILEPTKLVWADESNYKGPKCANCGWIAKSLSEVDP
jgi:hypothetical protein